MSSMGVDIMLSVAVLLCCVLLIAMRNRQKQKEMKRLLDYFSRLGSKYGLTFSSLEVLKHCIIGLDGVQRKLLVLNGINKGGLLTEYVIDLNEVSECTVRKKYGSIQVNGLRRRRLEQYLRKVTLHFRYHAGRQPADIPFYRREEDRISELPALERKVERWKVMLTKLLPLRLKKSA